MTIQNLTKSLLFMSLTFAGLNSTNLKPLNNTAQAEDAQQVVQPSDDKADIKSYTLIMTDDNPFLNVIPVDALMNDDDFGYTYGINLSFQKIKPIGKFEDYERWKLQYTSDLYTRDVTPPGQNLFPHTPQLYNEVTNLRLSWDDEFAHLADDKVYKIVGVGIGRINDMDPNSWNGILQQKVWHKTKRHFTPDQTNTYTYIDGNTEKYYASVAGALGRVVTFNENMKRCFCEIDRLKVEGGTEVISIQDGSRFYLLSEVNKSVYKTDNTTTSVNAKFSAEKWDDGAEDFNKTLSLQFDRHNWSFETGLTWISGDQNSDFYKYLDHDKIWFGKVEYHPRK